MRYHRLLTRCDFMTPPDGSRLGPIHLHSPRWMPKRFARCTILAFPWGERPGDLGFDISHLYNEYMACTTPEQAMALVREHGLEAWHIHS